MGMSHFIMMSCCIYIYPWDEYFYNPTRDCAKTTIHLVSSWPYFWKGKAGSFVPILLLTSPQQDRKHCICTGFGRVSEDQEEDRKREI